MLKSLTVQGFQAHANTRLEFCPGTNVIVGPSDVGKSAILRALQWVRTNRPLGTGFVRLEGGAPVKQCSVTVVTDGGNTVERGRSGVFNGYVVDGQSLQAVGTDVPAVVREVLAMPDVCFQAQMDGPYLLSASASEVGRVMNQAIGLDVIDRAMSGVAAMARAAGKTVAHLEGDVAQLEGQEAAFSDLDMVGDMVCELEEAEASAAGMQSAIDNLMALLGRLDASAAALVGMRDLAHVRLKLVKLEALQVQAVRGSSVLRRLDELVSEIQIVITKTSSMGDLGEFLLELQRLERLCKQAQDHQGRVVRLSRVLRGLAESAEGMNTAVATERAARAALEAAMPQVCPFYEVPCPLTKKKRGDK